MPTIALCWELGGGYGHLAGLRPLAGRLIERGWRVAVVARNVPAAGRTFAAEVGRGAVTLLQAPFRHGSALQFDATPTYAHILHNVGWGEAATLGALADGWRGLFDLLRPDLVAADHAPTALLAARSLGLPRLACGTGFSIPPDADPPPDLMPWRRFDADRSRAVAAAVLANANAALSARGAEPLGRLADLFHGERTARFLRTYPELDHYPGRTGETYRGQPPPESGPAPEWPDAAGPRVFAYLKPFAGLADLLAALSRRAGPTLVAGDVDPQLKARFAGRTLRFAAGLVDLNRVAAEADAAALHGGHGATAALLLGGVPLVVVPLQLEQILTARAVGRLGAGIAVDPETQPDYGRAIDAAASECRFRTAGAAFAARHRTLDPRRQLEAVADECMRLAERGS